MRTISICLLALVLAATPALTQDEDGKVVGYVDDPGGAAGSAAPKPPKPNPLLQILGDPTSLTPKQWRDKTLEICRKFPPDRRARLLGKIKGQPGSDLVFAGLAHGRRALQSELMVKAMEYGNADLAGRKLSPLNRALGVNMPVDDVTRDVDQTVFAGDDLREEAFFKGLARAADDLKLRCEPGPGGVEVPALDVNFFKGGNELPDPRYAKSVAAHVKKYREVLQRQRASAESYKGGGMKVEVYGRRDAAQAEAMELRWDDAAKKADYNGHLAKNCTELRALFRGSAKFRADQWQRASHMVSNTLFGLHADNSDPTKGTLKYAGRNLDTLCGFYGFKTWDHLVQDDKYRLLLRIFPEYDLKNPHHLKLLDNFAEACDVAFFVKDAKITPGTRSPEQLERLGKITEIFLRRSVAKTAGEMASAMIDPPGYDVKENLTTEERIRFDAMTANERFDFMREKDERFRWCTSFEAMEDLLMTAVELRQLDMDEKGNPLPRQPGAEALRGMIDAAPKETRQLLKYAEEYAYYYTASNRAQDAETCLRCMDELYRIRGEMKKHLRRNQTKGEEVLAVAVRKKPKQYIPDPSKGGRVETEFQSDWKMLNERWQEHVKRAFPTIGEEIEGFKKRVAKLGTANYLKERLTEEAFQMDTIVDGLQLIEMYQRGASAKEYGVFLAVNTLSRFHWSLGHIYAAWNVRSVEDLKRLGGNLFFATAARLIPGVGYVKVGFDIAFGTLNVTVGYMVRGENADTVDAVYVGDQYTGPLSAKRVEEGTVANALRESGFCLLDAGHFRVVEDPETGEKVRVVFRPALYTDYFQRFTGLEWDALPRRGAKSKDPELAKAHDELVYLLIEQAKRRAPLWVQDPSKPPKHSAYELTELEVEEATKKFYALLEKRCRTTARDLLEESARRTYRSIFEEEGRDVIEEELVRRFTADVYAGLMEAWELRLTQTHLARRSVERTAMNADLAELAKELAKVRFDTPRERRKPVVELSMKPVGTVPERDELEDLGIDMDAVTEGLIEASGLIDEGAEAVREWIGRISGFYDGDAPIRYESVIEGEGEVEDADGVAVEVKREKLTLIARADGGENDGGIGPGDVVLSEVTFVAKDERSGGEELGEQTVVSLVRIPLPESDGKIPVRHMKRFADADEQVFAEYDYIDWPENTEVPESWHVHDYLWAIVHGPLKFTYLDQDREVVRVEMSQHRFGHLHGERRIVTAGGRTTLVESYVNGKRHGACAYQNDEENYGDAPEGGHIEANFADGFLKEMIVAAKAGHAIVHATAELTGKLDTYGTPLYSGVVEKRYEDNGKPRSRGPFVQFGDGDTNSLDWMIPEVEGIRAYSKHGVWEAYDYDTGKLEAKETYVRNERHGRFERYDVETGKVVSRGDFNHGKQHGRWEYFYPSGARKAVGTWDNGDMVGTWTGYSEEGESQSEEITPENADISWKAAQRGGLTELTEVAD